MTHPSLTLAENAQSTLRVAVATVEQKLSALTHSGGPAVEELRDSWRAFLALLALEPEPARRDCPFCGGLIRTLATRCVHCWKQSVPPG